MNKTKIDHSRYTTPLMIILLFIIISFAYFPSCLEGKVLDASDYNVFSGASKELREFRNATGQEALWTNSMFGGMPAYTILTNYKGNIFQPWFSLVSSVPKPVNFVIINFCLFFLLGLVLGINPWIAFAASLAYGFSTFTFIFLGEGHITKVQAISYYPLLIAGIWLSYRNDRLKGSLLFVAGLSMILAVNHTQISYYAAILAFIIVITYFISAIRERELPAFFKSSGVLVASAILAVGISFGPMITTYEYSKHSTRGKSELAPADANKTSGLDRRYILDFSYDPGEVFTALIPRFRGGSNSEPMEKDSEIYRVLKFDQGQAEADKLIQNVPAYWGDQPISRGPFYFGVLFCFLFVLGIFMVKGKEKWWILAAVILAYIWSLGKNLLFVSNFLIDYLPGYNKFRAVNNILIIQHFAMAVLGMLAVREIYLRKMNSKEFFRALKYAFGITAGIALLFAIAPGLAGSFRGISDVSLIESGWPAEYIEALVSDRKTMLREDAFRASIFVSLGAAVIWAFRAGKMKAGFALVLWIILIFIDIWPVNKRYLNNQSFVSKRRAEVTFPPTEADKFILQDKDPSYRVLNLSLEPFTDTSTSYYHKSVGGNNGAKMRLYHEMIYFNISREIGRIVETLEKIKTDAELDSLLRSLNSINMLNTRYIIFNPDVPPLTNPYALGNAWFVDNYLLAESPDEEVRKIWDLDVKSVMVVDRKWEKFLSGKEFVKDPHSKIALKSYAPNKLVYVSDCISEQLALFSENYYPHGWKSSIDGVEIPHFKANYIFRAMVVPAGKHEITFEFRPQSYEIGNTVSLASSIIFFLIVAATGINELRKRTKKNQRNITIKSNK